MRCKYCNKRNHTIDHCPTILCKNCNKVGHPKWLCKEGESYKQYIRTEQKWSDYLWKES